MLGANLKFRKICVQLYVMHDCSSSRIYFLEVCGPYFYRLGVWGGIEMPTVWW